MKIYNKFRPAGHDLPGSPPVTACGFSRVIGYARVSTDKQDISLQRTALANAGIHILFEDVESGGDLRRPYYHCMRKMLEPGDTLIVYSFSRLARNLKDLLTIIDELKAERIPIRSTSEPSLDPYTRIGRMQVQMTGMMDEHERAVLSERTRDGMAERKRQGQRMGRPILMTDAKIKEAKRLRRQNMPVKTISKRLGVSVSAIYGNT